MPDFLVGKLYFSIVNYIFINGFSFLIRKAIYSETNSILMEEKAVVRFHIKVLPKGKKSYQSYFLSIIKFYEKASPDALLFKVLCYP